MHTEDELQKDNAKVVLVGFGVKGRMRMRNSIAALAFEWMGRSLDQTLPRVPRLMDA